MAEIKFDGGFMPLPINIKRGNPIPLDTTSIHYPTAGGLSALDNAKDYAKNNPVAYVGQIITVCEGIFSNDSFVPNMAHIDSGIYYIADKSGTLVKLVNNEIYSDDKKEDIEISYKDIEIVKDSTNNFQYAIIKSPRDYKKGTSDLFINGIKYNNSEYEEILKDGETNICDKIKFTAFEIIPQNESGVGDEITILADYE